ncbi:putative F-box cyclin-like [Rosellinia necatrix]|uniref:Putative F-box cyclin-like n=1 Tax=Rosellinia necatrix TaxID=77044 RepID=A0A1W2TP13_ROSNE|nr:putative F-box cyclin-like [Rosellinia necatrix]
MAEISQLPLGVLEDIVCLAMASKAPGIRMGGLASVDRLWQSIVEKMTFQEIRISVEDISTLMAMLGGRPKRFSLVRCLIFTAELPGYSELECQLIESNQDRFYNDLAFSKSMNILLTHLREWPSTGRTLELQIRPWSPTDERHYDDGQWYRKYYSLVADDILHNQRLRGTCVTKLSFPDSSDRYVAASGTQGLFWAFPKLRDIEIRFWDAYIRQPDIVRRAVRRRMAKALDEMPSTVGSMKFHVQYFVPANQRYSGKKAYADTDVCDPLTVAYRNTTQKMTIVDTYGMLGTPELFWPRQVDAANPAPFWPNLKYMEVFYHIHDPDGEWLFGKDLREPIRVLADTPMHDLPPIYTPTRDKRPLQYRWTAYQNKMDEFYSSVVKAVANMPKLVHLRLQAITFWAKSLTPLHAFEFNIEGRVGYASWIGIPPFNPSDEVLKAWRVMAYERGISLTFEWREKDEE